MTGASTTSSAPASFRYANRNGPREVCTCRLRRTPAHLPPPLSPPPFQEVSEPSLQLKLDVQSPTTGELKSARMALTATDVNVLLYGEAHLRHGALLQRGVA